jgi:hypothetical protein
MKKTCGATILSLGKALRPVYSIQATQTHHIHLLMSMTNRQENMEIDELSHHRFIYLCEPAYLATRKYRKEKNVEHVVKK